MFKKLVACFILILSTPLFARELQSFGEILDALYGGKHVSVLLVGKHCQINDPNEYKFPVGNAIIQLENVLFLDDKLSFDFVKYARPIPQIAPNGLIQRGSFILEKNGHLNVVIASYDAETNGKVPTRQNITIDCDLGKSVHFNAN